MHDQGNDHEYYITGTASIPRATLGFLRERVRTTGDLTLATRLGISWSQAEAELSCALSASTLHACAFPKEKANSASAA